MGYWLLLLTALVCMGAVDDIPEDETEPLSWLLENAISLALLAIVVAVLLGWGIVAARRMAQRNAEETEAMMRLEASVGTLLADRRPQTRSETPDESARTAAAVAPAEPVAAQDSPPAGATADTPPEAVDALLDKLRAGGLFADLEGMIYLSDGVSEGKIVRLTNGKTALVMAGMEPPEFLGRQLRRFDLCIVALGGDAACVVTPLGAYLADHFTL